MIDVNHSMSRCRRVPRPAVALLVGALLLSAAPAGAGWLGRGIGVAGTGKSVTETLAENTGIFGEMVGAFIDGDDERVSELMGEIRKTPGKLIKRAFPVLEAPQAVAEKLKSAQRKIERFVGGAGETLADARAALAVDRDRQGGGWSDAALLEGEPLPAPPETTFIAPRYESPTEVLVALTGGAERSPPEVDAKPADSSWDFEEWVIAKQEAKPHCYGVVDLETLPADCFSAAKIEHPVASLGPKQDSLYSYENREADRVMAYARGCWNHKVDVENSAEYQQFKTMMERREQTGASLDCAASIVEDDTQNGQASKTLDVDDYTEKEEIISTIAKPMKSIDAGLMDEGRQQYNPDDKRENRGIRTSYVEMVQRCKNIDVVLVGCYNDCRDGDFDCSTACYNVYSKNKNDNCSGIAY